MRGRRGGGGIDVPCGGQTLIRQRPERETDVPEKEKKKKKKTGRG